MRAQHVPLRQYRRSLPAIAALLLAGGVPRGLSASTGPIADGPRADDHALADAQVIKTTGHLDAVTVYRGQALVSRLIDLDPAPGLREIVVTDLPERILAQSLYAESVGAADKAGAHS